MTQIGALTLDTPMSYTYRSYVVECSGVQTEHIDLTALRELFALARVGTAVHDIPGRRPVGEDMDDALRNTQYIIFTDGVKPITAWYLLRGFGMFEDLTPMGLDGMNFVLSLFFIGTVAEYQAGFVLKGFAEDPQDDNDWGL